MCDLACQAKLRLNGARVMSGVKITLDEVQRHLTNDGKLKRGPEMIKLLNLMEDLSDRLARVAMEDIGHTGPFNRSLAIANGE